MRPTTNRSWTRAAALAAGLAMMAAEGVSASPTLTYAVTDMGLIRGPYGPLTGPDYIISDEALVYHGFESWPRQPDADVYPTLPLAQPENAGIPGPGVITGAPYNYISRAYANSDASVVAYTQQYGVINVTAGVSQGAVVKKDESGEWVKVLDLGSVDRGARFGIPPQIRGVNDRNQVWAMAASSGAFDPRLSAGKAFLYDVDSDTFIDPSGILGESWKKVSIVALDRNGRILLWGEPADGDGRAHYVMLSPTDLEPIIPTPVPEPGALAVFACAAVGLMIRRQRRRSA